jgi:hypothetical protein
MRHVAASIRGYTGKRARARSGMVPSLSMRGGAAVNQAPAGGSCSRPVRCSTTGMPAASSSVCAGRSLSAVSSMLSASIPTPGPGIGCAHGRGRSRAPHIGPEGARPTTQCCRPAPADRRASRWRSRGRRSRWRSTSRCAPSRRPAMAGHPARRRGHAPGIHLPFARVDRSSSRTPHQQRRPFLLRCVAPSRTKRWEDRQPSCFTCSRW